MTTPTQSSPSSEVPAAGVHEQEAFQNFSLIYALILFIEKLKVSLGKSVFLMKMKSNCDCCFVIFFLVCLGGLSVSVHGDLTSSNCGMAPQCACARP